MTDIVERARGFLGSEKRASSFAEAGDCSIACRLLREAVDEVEKLQAVKGKLVLAAEVVKLEDEVARLRDAVTQIARRVARRGGRDLTQIENDYAAIRDAVRDALREGAP